MSQKIYRNQNTLGSATINPCHTDISLMTEREIRDTSLKRLLKGGGGVVDKSTIKDLKFISSEVILDASFYISCAITSFYKIMHFYVSDLNL